MEWNSAVDVEASTRRLFVAWACTTFLIGPSSAYTLCVGALLLLGIRLEAKVLRMELITAGGAPAQFLPPTFAAFFLYLTLPRRQQEPIIGDLNEDFATNVLPRFGPLLAGIWYWYKALLCVSMYACENAIEPLIRRVVEPLWRCAVLPLLKWTVAPVLVIHKLNWGDAVRTFIDKLR
jgi:hypothetical protein